MDTRLTVEQILAETTKMGKLEKGERYSALQAFCNKYRYDDEAILQFYRKTPYTAKHGFVATGMYLQYGVAVYEKIKGLFPSNSGNIYSSWDDFMIDQADRVCYVFPHTDPYITYNGRETYEEFRERQTQRDRGIKSKFELFIYDIEEICDDDLYVEIMCRIARSEYQSYLGLDKSNYIIDYDYMKRRYDNLSKTAFGMKRFVQLLKSLADYSQMDAFQAWGDFYYLFEEVYAQKPPTGITYTGEIYNVLFAASYSGDDDFYGKKHRVDSMIRNYGWTFLHHAFEINTQCDWCLDWIYKSLPVEDQKKADAAIKEYSKKEKPKKNIVIKSNNTVATDDELKEIESILKEDVDTGFMAWSQLLYRIMAANRISKEMLKRCMDRIVWNISNYELYDGDGLILQRLDDAKRIKYYIPKIYKSILDNESICDYFFANFQLISTPFKIAKIPIILNNRKTFEMILSSFRNNNRVAMTENEFVKRVFDYIYDPFTRISSYVERTMGCLNAEKTGNYNKVIEGQYADIIYENYYAFDYSYKQIIEYIYLNSGKNWKDEFEIEYDNIQKEIGHLITRIENMEKVYKNA